MGLSGSAGAGLLDEPRGPEAQREGQQGVHHGQARQEDSTTQFRAKGALSLPHGRHAADGGRASDFRRP